MRRRPDPRKSDLGRTIVLLANLLDMSQKQLAKKIGMSDQAISDWCRGQSSPGPKAREEVLKALRCSWRELEEVVALIFPLRVELERRRDAKPLDAGWQVKELSSLLRLPGSMRSDSSLPDSPGLPGDTTSTDDKRIWEMGSLLDRLLDLAARAPDRKGKPRR
jgi:transcriptional regulator with XRE-family HTH domain